MSFYDGITPATKELNFRHSGECRNPVRRLDAPVSSMEQAYQVRHDKL